MLKVAVLVSGGGTNLQAIIDAIDNKVITDTEIVAVISNNKNAFALERAKKVGIAAEVVSLRITRTELDSTRHSSQSFRRPERIL
nr:formyltransferase family protein [Coprococcus sp. OM06-25]